MKVLSLDIKDLNNKAVEYVQVKGIDVKLYISKQKTGFGYKKFFVCPVCGSRRETLYIFNLGEVYCRSCSPKWMYKGITHTTKGGTDEIEYRMARVAAEYRIKLEYPFKYYNVTFDRPKYMRVNKWNEGLHKLQILENMRNQTIFFNAKYNAALIKYVLDHCLYVYRLTELEKYFFNWNNLKIL